ncbi:THO complex subunit 7, partial [Phenoliferia sp. Uapishka_3]
MHNLVTRANNASTTVTSALMTLLVFIALSSFIIPTTLDSASLKVSNLNVQFARLGYDRSRGVREHVFSTFDVVAGALPSLLMEPRVPLWPVVLPDVLPSTHGLPANATRIVLPWRPKTVRAQWQAPKVPEELNLEFQRMLSTGSTLLALQLSPLTPAPQQMSFAIRCLPSPVGLFDLRKNVASGMSVGSGISKFVDTEAQQELARIRALADNKALKKVIQQFYRLVNTGTSGEELQAAHAAFVVGLDQFTMQLLKNQRIEQITEVEVAHYEKEAQDIESTHTQMMDKLSDLNAKLVLAQRDRGRTIEYDMIAKDIGKLPDRAQGLESRRKLHEDIQLLKDEQEQYKETWARRRREFGEIVDSLTTMSEAISEEKNEQERRRALDDEEDPATSLDPTAQPFAPGGSTSKAPLEIGDDGDATPMDADAMDDGEGGQVAEDDVTMVEGTEQLEEGQEREEKEDGEMS